MRKAARSYYLLLVLVGSAIISFGVLSHSASAFTAGVTATKWKEKRRSQQCARHNNNAISSSSDDDVNNVRSYDVSSGSITPRPGSMAAARLETGKVPYGEGSRQYRRTVFLRSSDWVSHRNPDRLFYNLRFVFLSGVARQLAKGIWTMSAVALAVVVWNGLLETRTFSWGGLVGPELLGYFKIRLPPQPFSFSASALGLLLVFRTNSSYQRWLEGQNNIARIVANLKNILRMASTWLPPGEESSRVQLKDLGLASWAVLRTLQNHLRSPELEEASFVTHVRKTLDQHVAEKLIQSKDRPFWAIHDLSASIQNLSIDDAQKREIDKSVVTIMDCIESCTKIIRFPVPLVYTRHTSRFLAAWLALLPLAMYDAFAQSWKHILLIPATAVLSFFFLGIDELAIQLEEPFSILPLEYHCAAWKRRASQAVEWHAGGAHKHRHSSSSKE